MSKRLTPHPTRALALKAPTLLRKINAMSLRNRPMSDKHLQRVTVGVSYIGQTATLSISRPGDETKSMVSPMGLSTF